MLTADTGTDPAPGAAAGSGSDAERGRVVSWLGARALDLCCPGLDPPSTRLRALEQAA